MSSTNDRRPASGERLKRVARAILVLSLAMLMGVLTVALLAALD